MSQRNNFTFNQAEMLNHIPEASPLKKGACALLAIAVAQNPDVIMPLMEAKDYKAVHHLALATLRRINRLIRDGESEYAAGFPEGSSVHSQQIDSNEVPNLLSSSARTFIVSDHGNHGSHAVVVDNIGQGICHAFDANRGTHTGSCATIQKFLTHLQSKKSLQVYFTKQPNSQANAVTPQPVANPASKPNLFMRIPTENHTLRLFSSIQQLAFQSNIPLNPLQHVLAPFKKK